MRSQRADNAVEDKRYAHCRDKESNDSGDGVDAHSTDEIDKPSGISEAEIGDDDGEEGRAEDRRISGRLARSIVAIIPSTVAITPGPTIRGMARGMTAILSAGPGLRKLPWPFPAGEKSSKPIRVSTMPPAIRTILSETPNILSTKAPKNRKNSTKTNE
jgi:hypothetical protein